MQFNQQSFQKPQLILKYFRKELTSQEKAELDSWLEEDERNRLLLDKLRRDPELEKEFLFLSSVNRERGWEQTLLKLRQRKKRPWPKLISYWRVAAAAAGITLAMWGGYRWVLKDRLFKKDAGIANLAPENTIVPGEDKAKLTLADGSEIVLDDTGAGILGEGKGFRISGREGEVTYQPASDAALNGEPTNPSGAPGGTEEAYHTLTIPRGGQYRLVLPDGSKVWLNAASEIRFPAAFSGRERLVELEGEAYFEVAPDSERPFRVNIANRTTVEVLGTHFNIMAYREEAYVETTVLEGSVQVTDGIRVPGSRRRETRNREPSKPYYKDIEETRNRVLTHGQQARLNKASASLKVAEVNTSEVVAWKNGLFRFRNDNIRSVMKQISRWYDVSVRYQGELPDAGFTGMISRKVEISQVLSMLERTGGVHFRIEGRNIVVTK